MKKFLVIFGLLFFVQNTLLDNKLTASDGQGDLITITEVTEEDVIRTTTSFDDNNASENSTEVTPHRLGAIFSVLNNCKEGEQLDKNGRCRKIVN